MIKIEDIKNININSINDFESYYGSEINNFVWENILECFYYDEYIINSEKIELMSNSKDSLGSPQNPEYTFSGSFLFDEKIFYFLIRDGIGNGTEFKDVYLDVEESFDHQIELHKDNTQRKIEEF